MANKGNQAPGEKSRFRFILLEGEVATGELQQFAQTVAAALRPASAAPLPPRPQQVALAAPKPPAEERNLFSDVVSEEPDEVQTVAPEVAPAAKSQNGAKKKLRTPQLISELEFVSGTKPLANYINEVDPKEHSKRYLAIIYWLRQHRSVTEVSTDHVYTCYRALGLNVPKDVGSVLRALKGQEWLEPGSKAGFYKMTHIGENQLTKASE